MVLAVGGERLRQPGDGLEDLAQRPGMRQVGPFACGDLVAVFINDGTGKFGKPTRYRVDGFPMQVTIADLRNDGRQDLVVADIASGLDIWLNKGDGTFGSVNIYYPGCESCQPPEACTVADFNLDGKLDVACATQNFQSYYFYGNGRGKVSYVGPLNDDIDGDGGFSIVAGDFNNDGAPTWRFP